MGKSGACDKAGPENWAPAYAGATAWPRIGMSSAAGPERFPGMPLKVRDLIAKLKDAGFVNRGGKGSHRNFVHPKLAKPVTMSGSPGDDAQAYQIKAVKHAVEESES